MSGGFPFNERRDEELWMREILSKCLASSHYFLAGATTTDFSRRFDLFFDCVALAALVWCFFAPGKVPCFWNLTGLADNCPAGGPWLGAWEALAFIFIFF